MTNRLHSHLAGTCAACMVMAAAGTAALWAGEAPAPLEAGAWQITQEIETLEAPGLPAALVERMASDPGKAPARTACLASSSEAQPDPALFHAPGGQCFWESWQAQGGMLTAVLACTPPNPAAGSARISLSGTYTATSFALLSQTTGRNATGELELRLVTRLAGRRTGACKGQSSPASQPPAR